MNLEEHAAVQRACVHQGRLLLPDRIAALPDTGYPFAPIFRNWLAIRLGAPEGKQ